MISQGFVGQEIGRPLSCVMSTGVFQWHAAVAALVWGSKTTSLTSQVLMKWLEGWTRLALSPPLCDLRAPLCGLPTGQLYSIHRGSGLQESETEKGDHQGCSWSQQSRASPGSGVKDHGAGFHLPWGRGVTWGVGGGHGHGSTAPDYQYQLQWARKFQPSLSPFYRWGNWGSQRFHDLVSP